MLVRVRVLGSDCLRCREALRAEAGSQGGNAIVEVDVSWLRRECPHGRGGVWMELIATKPAPGNRVEHGEPDKGHLAGWWHGGE